MSTDYDTTLEVGDRVAQDMDGWPDGSPRLGTIEAIRFENGNGRSLFDVRWDSATDDHVSRGWLRHALRKVPKGSHV